MTKRAATTDPTSEAIERQTLACTLVAVRSRAQREGKWDEATHAPLYRAKYNDLAEKWK